MDEFAAVITKFGPHCAPIHQKRFIDYLRKTFINLLFTKPNLPA